MNQLDTNQSNRPAVLLAMLYYFLVIAAFWILKPLRVSLVVEAYGPEAYPILKQSSVLLVPLVFMIYRRLAVGFPERALTLVFSLFFAIASGIFGLAFWSGVESTWMPGAFYYLVEVYSAVVITHFWVHLTRGGKHLKEYVGTITIGGLLGGISASVATGWFTNEMGYGVIGLFSALVLASLVAHLAQRRNADEESRQESVGSAPVPPAPIQGQAGSSVRISSSFALLGGTAAIFAIYEIVSTVLDSFFVFQLRHQMVEQNLMAAYQGKVAFVGQVLALTFQMLFISAFRTGRGIRFGLYVLPLSLLAGSLGYALHPDLSVIAITVSADIALSNSLFLSSRESLFQRLGERLRLQLESFTEIVVRRAGKVAGAALVVYLSLDNPTLSVVNVLAIAAWLAAVTVVLSCVRAVLRREVNI